MKQTKKLNKEFFSGEALYEAIKAIRNIHMMSMNHDAEDLRTKN